MKNAFTEYLEGLGIKKESKLYARIESAHAVATFLCPEGDIKEVFVCEWPDGEGRRNYQAVWFFSTNYTMECKQLAPEGEEIIDIVFIATNIRHCEVRKRDFEFGKKATDKSMCRMQVLFGMGSGGLLFASAANCEKLAVVYQTYIKPNIRQA
jgi:hypothetical protein